MRLRDWQSRLDACIRESRSLPFAWGSHDCILFAADCVSAVTGTDPAAEQRGTYSDAMGAARILKEHGGMAALAGSCLGLPITARQAQVGDIGMLDQEGRDMLAVCAGSYWLAPGADGLVALPIGKAVAAWRVC